MTDRVCSSCIMDTTVSRITFDQDGVCNYCQFHNQMVREHPMGEPGAEILDKIYTRVQRQGKNKRFDCIVGVSGGRDSSYLLYHLSQIVGLRCLAVHFNDGFGNPIAGENMQKITRALGIELRTISADWRESKDLKISCLKASTPDLNLATDLGLGAALYGVATAENVRSVFIGQSFRTEGIAPLEWNYLDGRYLLAIQKQFGTLELRPWAPKNPGYHLNWNHLLYYTVVRRIRTVTPFYFMDYVRSDIDKILVNELNWKDPGAHYFDDLYQALLTFVLRTKFNIDRRKFNYSALIRSGQMTRNDGLKKIGLPYSIEDSKIIDLCIKRLGLSQEEFKSIIDVEPKTFRDYPNLLSTIKKSSFFVKILAKAGIIPKSTFVKYCGDTI